MTEANVLAPAIWITSVSILLIPFYIYAILKWYHFQRHFIVSKRFPMITNCIVVATIFGTIQIVTRKWMEVAIKDIDILYSNNILWRIFSSTGQASSYITNMLVIHRVLLVYLRWKRCQNDIKQIKQKQSNKSMTDSDGNNNLQSVHTSPSITPSITPSSTTITTSHLTNSSIDSINISRGHALSLSDIEMTTQNIMDQNQNVYRHKASIFFIIIMIFGTIYINLSYIFDITAAVIWSMPVISGIIIIILIKSKGVQEGN